MLDASLGNSSATKARRFCLAWLKDIDVNKTKGTIDDRAMCPFGK
jgi:hypothetical protein